MMTPEEAFDFINGLVMAKQPKSLSDVEKCLVLGIWQGKTYDEIALDKGYAAQYLRETASKLFRAIRENFGIKVSKTNFKTAIEQQWKQQQEKTGDALEPASQEVLALAAPQVEGSRVGSEKAIANPFIPLTGVADDPQLFFDRKRETAQILELLDSRSSVALIGNRAIGKSSLLLAICREIQNKPQTPRKPAYMNLQKVENEDDFYSYLCDTVGIPDCRGYSLTRSLKKHRLILAIDEVEKMAGDGFTHKVREHLRGLAEGSDAPLRLILAARTPLDRLFKEDRAEGKTSPLEGICIQVNLEAWDEATARAFIADRLAPTEVRFTEEEIARVIAETGGHPQKLMKLCNETYARDREKAQ